MKFMLKLNPLLAYLLKRKYVNFVQAFMPIIGFWVGCIPLIFIILGLNSFDINIVFGLAVWSLIYVLLMLFPVAIAYFCTSATSRSIVREDYELLTLTSIADNTILWSYVAATLYRLRSLLIVAIGLAPLIFMMLSVVWIGSHRSFNGSICVSTPIRNLYCVKANDDPPPTSGEKIAALIQVAGTLVMLAGLTAGINVLMAFTGAILGFWRQNRFIVLVVASVLAFAVCLLVGIVIIPEIALQTFVAGTVDPFLLLLTVILTAAPYLLTFELVRRASSLVRRPA